jgi:hypothetical protein
VRAGGAADFAGTVSGDSLHQPGFEFRRSKLLRAFAVKRGKLILSSHRPHPPRSRPRPRFGK